MPELTASAIVTQIGVKSFDVLFSELGQEAI